MNFVAPKIVASTLETITQSGSTLDLNSMIWTAHKVALKMIRFIEVLVKIEWIVIGAWIRTAVQTNN